jgi:hypothetical protein
VPVQGPGASEKIAKRNWIYEWKQFSRCFNNW